MGLCGLQKRMLRRLEFVFMDFGVIFFLGHDVQTPRCQCEERNHCISEVPLE